MYEQFDMKVILTVWSVLNIQNIIYNFLILKYILISLIYKCIYNICICSGRRTARCHFSGFGK